MSPPFPAGQLSAMVEPAPAMKESEIAFWSYFDAGNEARLTATDMQKLLGVSRSNWYNWTTHKNTPFAYRIERMRRATRHLRAALAERSLPAMTSPARRKFVKDLVDKLERGEDASV